MTHKIGTVDEDESDREISGNGRRQTDICRRSARARYHIAVLTVALFVIALSFALQLRNGEAISVPFLGKLPGICTWKITFGVDCPGCGLTRCFVEIAHGRWNNAWHYNPGGFLLFSLVLYQIPFRGIQLWRLRGGSYDSRHHPLHITLAVWSVVVALAAQWAVKHCT